MFVAPDDPLAAGMVDALEKEGIPCIRPARECGHHREQQGVLEESDEEIRYSDGGLRGVLRPESRFVEYVEKRGKFPVVIKADGLALGKGVIIAQNFDEAKDAVHTIMEDKVFGASGNNVVVEEFLTGPEVSVLAFTDGKTAAARWCPLKTTSVHWTATRA